MRQNKSLAIGSLCSGATGSQNAQKQTQTWWVTHPYQSHSLLIFGFDNTSFLFKAHMSGRCFKFDLTFAIGSWERVLSLWQFLCQRGWVDNTLFANSVNKRITFISYFLTRFSNTDQGYFIKLNLVIETGGTIHDRLCSTILGQVIVATSCGKMLQHYYTSHQYTVLLKVINFITQGISV